MRKVFLLLVVLSVNFCACNSTVSNSGETDSPTMTIDETACNSTFLEPGVTYYADKESSDFSGYGKDTYRVEFTIYKDGSVSGKTGVLDETGELPPTSSIGTTVLEGEWSEISKNDKRFIEIIPTLDGHETNPIYVDEDLNFYFDGVNTDAIKLNKK